MNIRNITHVYRQTADEGAGGSAGAPVETPTEETPPVVETPPVETPPETPPVDTGDDHLPEVNLWDALSRDTDEDDSLEEAVSPTPEPEVTPPPSATEESPPPAETPAAETPPVEPVVPPVETPPSPEAQPTPVAPEPPATQEPSAEDLATADTKARGEMQAKLSEHYKMTEAESLQLLSDPGEFLPKYQARIWTDMWYAMQTMISNSMPSLIQSNLREVEDQQTYVNDFFTAWPKLNQKEHGKTVSEVAKVYSQVNPTATTEEVTKFVGMQVMLHHGIAPDLVPVDTPPGAPATPTPPVTPPYQPAAVNAAPAAQQSGSGNLYSDMAEELLEDDLT